jgi:integrase
MIFMDKLIKKNKHYIILTSWQCVKKSYRIFMTAIEEAANPNSFTSWLRKFIHHPKLFSMPFHIFRYMAATSLISSGIDVGRVSKKLGHSQKSTTMNIYTHILHKAPQKAATIMSEILKKTRND